MSHPANAQGSAKFIKYFDIHEYIDIENTHMNI